MIQIHRNNLQYFCRTCLEQLQSGASNYHIGQTPNLTKLLIICTSLSIKNDEDAVYPQWLCKKCYDMLQHIRHFREMTLRSADVLHKIVKDSSDHTNATTSTTSDGYFHDSGYTANQDVKIEVGATHMLENYCRNEKADNFDEFILDSDSSAPSTSTAKKRKQINEIDGKFGCRIVGCYEKFKNHKTLEAHMKLEHASGSPNIVDNNNLAMDICSDDENINAEDEADAHVNENNFEFNHHETDELLSLLMSWNLDNLYNNFYAQNITLDILKIIKIHHIERLLRNYDLRTQIVFETCLENWRSNIGYPMQYCSSRKENSVNLQERNEVSTTNILLKPLVCATAPTVTKSGTSSNASLVAILGYTYKGKLLTKYYEENKHFQDAQRLSLIKLIAHYFDDFDLHLSFSKSTQLEKEILERFPTEKIEYYRTSSNKGKIYNKYCNLKYLKRDASTKRIRESSVESKKPSFVPETDAEEVRRSLKNDKLPRDEYMKRWKACTGLRLKNIAEASTAAEIFELWPEYKRLDGHQLIDLDFVSRFPYASTILNNFHKNAEKILDFLRESVSYQKIKDVLKKLDNTLSEDSKDAILLWSLHGYLTPQHRNIKKDENGKQNVTRYTIAESQESFIVIGKSWDELNDKLHVLESLHKKNQPLIMVVGDLFCIKEIFISYEEVKISCKSLLCAFDICFKIFQLFNLEYPLASKTFWNFIQVFFYHIESEKKYGKVVILVDEIKKRLQNE